MQNEQDRFLRRNYNFEIRAEKKDGEENKGKYTVYGLPIVYDSRTDIGWFDEINALEA